MTARLTKVIVEILLGKPSQCVSFDGQSCLSLTVLGQRSPVALRDAVLQTHIRNVTDQIRERLNLLLYIERRVSHFRRSDFNIQQSVLMGLQEIVDSSSVFGKADKFQVVDSVCHDDL